MDNLDQYGGLVAMLAPVVAAYVGVAKEMKMPKRFNHLLALCIAAVFVLVPETVQYLLVEISVIGLTASGIYHFTKKREDKSDVNQRN